MARDLECARRTRDHTIPSSLGGIRVVLSCEGCNSIKKDAPEKVFRFFVSCNIDLFRGMTVGTRGHVQRRFCRFVYDLTLAGFVAAKALAQVKKTYGDDLPPREPNGRFTRRDLRRGE